MPDARSSAARSLAATSRSAAGELRRDSVEPLYRQLVDLLRADIAAARLAPGDRLPSEAALVATHGLSRVTVRQALAVLQAEGLVQSRVGKGSFVQAPRLHHDLDLLQGFREVLQRQGVAPVTGLLAFEPRGGDDDPQRPPGLAHLPVRLVRRYELGGQPFAVVMAWLPERAAAIGERRAARMAAWDIVAQLGHAVGWADVRIRAERANAEVATALGLKSRAPVLVMSRITHDADTGAACEAMRIHLVPERYEFRVRLGNGAGPAVRRTPTLHCVDDPPATPRRSTP